MEHLMHLLRASAAGLGIACLAATLSLSVSVDHAVAQDDLNLDLGVEDESTNPKDPEIQKPAIDPFRALILPKKQKREIRRVTPVVKRPTGPPPPPPPVNFQVVAIAGEDPNFVAVIDYKNNTFIVQPGTKVPPEAQVPDFEVKSVTAGKVEVYDGKAQRLVRRRLPESPGLN